jgi:quinoprotein glucose dehydrogenase
MIQTPKARAILFGSLLIGLAAAEQNRRTWMDYGGGLDSSHYVALTQINKSNVNQLKIAWSYPTGDNRSYLFNPIIVDNVMYLLARNSSLVALDAATGKEIWIHENLPGLTTRGVTYWESKDRKDRRLIFTINNFIQQIDASTGKSILTFGKSGLVDLREGLGRDPQAIARIQSENPGRVFENLILLGSATGEAYLSPPGDIRAFDVITGRLVWTLHTIPHPGEFGYETWPKDAWKYAGGSNTWGEITIDEKRGIAYFPTGSPTYDYYGADRPGTNLFGNCLLALDARTGKRLWHFQMVHHDLWDYDASAAPQLITVRHSGKRIDAVAQATKQGFLYVFDRVTGKPLWPIEERPVPKSDMPGEKAWPTQPIPTVPPPFARQKMTAADVNPYILTLQEQASWKDRIASLRNEGLFTPPGLYESLSSPGARGGANWGSTAANPSKGMVYLTTQDWPTIYRLSLEDPFAARAGGGSEANTDPGGTAYGQRCQSCHGIKGVRSGSGPPALAGAGSRLGFDTFRRVVLSGRAEMPAFPDLDNTTLNAILNFLGSAGDSAAAVSKGTAIVASGGAPGGLELRAPTGPRYSQLGGPPYPEGLDTPGDRYYTRWGLYPDQPFIINPPWSSVMAYDLNKGTIKWRVPFGQDSKAAEEGATDTGAFMAEHHGMIVTATGLIFLAASDGKLRAYDEETGKTLWTVTLPSASEGIPAMYEVNGRQYLVVSACSNPNTAGRGRVAATGPGQVKGYVAFALPERSGR